MRSDANDVYAHAEKPQEHPGHDHCFPGEYDGCEELQAGNNVDSDPDQLIQLNVVVTNHEIGRDLGFEFVLHLISSRSFDF